MEGHVIIIMLRIHSCIAIERNSRNGYFSREFIKIWRIREPIKGKVIEIEAVRVEPFENSNQGG